MKPYYDHKGITIYAGDCRAILTELPADSVQCVVTSPPYWGLRDYGVEDQIGLESTPEEYVETMVGVFREVRRVLRKDGTCWVNMGDGYNTTSGFSRATNGHHREGRSGGAEDKREIRDGILKPKDLIGMPWRLAFALQADGWYLRSDIIWHKPNPMPESVTDRPTKSHEYIFLLAKSQRYYYDAEAIREPHQREPSSGGVSRHDYDERKWKESCDGSTGNRPPMTMANRQYNPNGRNKRSVWTIPTAPYPDAHFATFPPKLIEPCILAGCPEGGVVLDPFLGSGTTAQVAKYNGRGCIGIELNEEYAELALKRLRQEVLF